MATIRSRPQTKEWDENYDRVFRPRGRDCPLCGGSGYAARGQYQCPDCHGTGYIETLVEER